MDSIDLGVRLFRDGQHLSVRSFVSTVSIHDSPQDLPSCTIFKDPHGRGRSDAATPDVNKTRPISTDWFIIPPSALSLSQPSISPPTFGTVLDFSRVVVLSDKIEDAASMQPVGLDPKQRSAQGMRVELTKYSFKKPKRRAEA